MLLNSEPTTKEQRKIQIIGKPNEVIGGGTVVEYTCEYKIA